MNIDLIQNSDLHLEHNQWKTALSLWKDELKSFNKRLEEMVVRYTDKDVLVKVEHYQNLFLIHDEAIHALQLHIEVHETNMAYHSKKGEDAIDLVYIKQHTEIKDRMETQRKIFDELKKEFFDFLLKYK